MDSFSEYSALRANIYKLLALPFYTEATFDYFTRLKSYIPVFEKMAEEFNSVEIAEGVSLVKEFFNTNPDLEETVKQYRRFFVRLFLGISQLDEIKNICPQESYYLSPKHLTMQKQRDEVLELYCLEGIGKTENFKEPEDHISAEFHFMAHMCKRGSLAENNLNVQQEFLSKHLLQWVPLLCAELYIQAGKLPDESGVRAYYQGLAKLTEGFVKCEGELVEKLSSEQEQTG